MSIYLSVYISGVFCLCLFFCFIQGLGFDREVCVNALRRTNNNVEAAADRLFSGAN